MGGCFSSAVKPNYSAMALVISATGDLRQYSTPVYVSDVLQEVSSSSSSLFFVCNSDSLCYDEHITALGGQDELDAGQIYFVLPVSKLRDRLSASEMAALAVKASVALNRKQTSRNRRRSKISPNNFVVMESSSSKMKVIVEEKQVQAGLGVSRSAGSIRKMSSSRKPHRLMAVRSFRLRLSTIYETHDHSSHNNK